jgi:hypothetical protein
MYGSGPDDGDVLEMGPEKPPRTWAIGRRTRRVLIAAGVCVLLAVGGTVAAVRLSAPSPAAQALARLVTEVTTVPAGVAVPASAAVSDGGYYYESSSSSSTSAYSSALSINFPFPTPVSGPPLTADGKPEVLYVANEYCPYCVAENWSLIVALSRFGQFTGLSTSRSPAFANIAPIDGWTFSGSSYTSPYLAFVPVENRSNVLVRPKADPAYATSYRVRQKLTPAQQAVFGTFDSLGQTPFLDFGGKATMLGSTVSPPVLAGSSWSTIAAGLRRPESPADMAIIAGAHTLTAEFCQLTHDRPAAACRP